MIFVGNPLKLLSLQPGFIKCNGMFCSRMLFCMENVRVLYPPMWLKIRHCPWMIPYHVTSPKYLKSLLRDGLIPGGFQSCRMMSFFRIFPPWDERNRVSRTGSARRLHHAHHIHPSSWASSLWCWRFRNSWYHGASIDSSKRNFVRYGLPETVCPCCRSKATGHDTA